MTAPYRRVLPGDTAQVADAERDYHHSTWADLILNRRRRNRAVRDAVLELPSASAVYVRRRLSISASKMYVP